MVWWRERHPSSSTSISLSAMRSFSFAIVSFMLEHTDQKKDVEKEDNSNVNFKDWNVSRWESGMKKRRSWNVKNWKNVWWGDGRNKKERKERKRSRNCTIRKPGRGWKSITRFPWLKPDSDSFHRENTQTSSSEKSKDLSARSRGDFEFTWKVHSWKPLDREGKSIHAINVKNSFHAYLNCKMELTNLFSYWANMCWVRIQILNFYFFFFYFFFLKDDWMALPGVGDDTRNDDGSRNGDDEQDHGNVFFSFFFSHSIITVIETVLMLELCFLKRNTKFHGYKNIIAGRNSVSRWSETEESET